MTIFDTKILLAILGDFAKLRAIDLRTLDRRRDTALVMRVDDACDRRLVPLSVAHWAGGYSGAAIKAAQRSLARLEAAGLIARRARWGGRTTHIELTEAGENAGSKLAKGKP